MTANPPRKAVHVYSFDGTVAEYDGMVNRVRSGVRFAALQNAQLSRMHSSPGCAA